MRSQDDTQELLSIKSRALTICRVQSRQLDLDLAPPNAHRPTILSLHSQIEADVLPRDVGEAIRPVWRDPAVEEAVRRSHEFQLNDSEVYYNAIDRMSPPRLASLFRECYGPCVFG